MATWYYPDCGYELIQWIRLLRDNKLDEYPNITKTVARKLNKIHKYIIVNNLFAFAYFCALEFPYKQYRMQNVVLKSKSAKFAYLFARDIEVSDKKAFGKLVMKTKNYKYMCKFACDVGNINLKRVEKILKSVQNPKYIYEMLKCNKITDIEQFKSILIDSNKPRYLYEISKYIKDEEQLKIIEQKIIDSESFTYMRLFCEAHLDYDFNKIETYILLSDNLEEMQKFGKSLKDSRVNRLLIFT